MAAEQGLIASRAALEDWLAALVSHGSLRNDLLLLAAAYHCAAAGDINGLADANALARALQPSAERYLETTQQGGSFLAAIKASWPHAALHGLTVTFAGDVSYPIAVGVAAAAHRIPLAATLEAFAFTFVTNLTSAAIRLSIVGQTDAQSIIASLSPMLINAAHQAGLGTLDDIGGATFSADLCSLEHETQYSRLFRS